MDRRPRIALALGVSFVSLWLAASGTALGHSNGLSGASGKSSVTCNNCHQGGEPPKVTLTGPTRLEAGVPALYTFRVETTNKLTGMNAASTDDVVLALAGDAGDAGGLRLDNGEVVHQNPRKVVDGGTEYSFLVTAKYGEPITLYAAGNAANDDGQSSGDRSSTTNLQIQVDGPPRPPPVPVPVPAPKPTATAPAPAPIVADAATDAGTVPLPSDDGGCALVTPGSSSGGASAGAGALLLGLLFTRALRRRHPARK
jgi:hypothetical protein